MEPQNTSDDNDIISDSVVSVHDDLESQDTSDGEDTFTDSVVSVHDGLESQDTSDNDSIVAISSDTSHSEPQNTDTDPSLSAFIHSLKPTIYFEEEEFLTDEEMGNEVVDDF